MCCLLLAAIPQQAKIFKHKETENSSKQINLSENVCKLDQARKLEMQMI